MNGVLHQNFKLVPVLAQQLKLKSRRNRVHIPRFGHRLKAAHHQTTHFFFVVDVAIGVSHHGPHGVNALYLIGHNVEMLGRIKRHIDTGQLPKLTRPLARTVHQNIALNIALLGFHTFDATVVQINTCDFNVLKNFDAMQPCPFGQGHAQISRVGLPVSRNPNAAC